MEVRLQENIEELDQLVVNLNNKLLPFLDAKDFDAPESVSEAKNSLERWIEMQSAKVQAIKARIVCISDSLFVPEPVQQLYHKENDPQPDMKNDK